MSEEFLEDNWVNGELQVVDLEERSRWLQDCQAAELHHRTIWENKQTVSRSLTHPPKPWEAPGLTEPERHYLHMRHEHKMFFASGARFSPAAYAIVHTPEAAHFFDTIQQHVRGDSGHTASLSRQDGVVDDALFDRQFDYTEDRVDAYTESGMIVHVRETLDPAATSREQRFFIVVVNLLAKSAKRLYADEHRDVDPVPPTTGLYDQTVPLRTHQLGLRSGLSGLDASNPYTALYQSVRDGHDFDMQPQLRFVASRGAVFYKPEGYADFSQLHPIQRLNQERHLLAKIALAAGHELAEDSEGDGPPSRTRVA